MFDSPGQTDRVREEMTVDMPEIMFRLEQFGAPGDATWIPRVQDCNFGNLLILSGEILGGSSQLSS